MEKTYGMFSLKMSKIFWEVAESFIGKFEYVLEIRGGLLQDREILHVEKTRKRRTPLPNCVGFVACSNITICGPVVKFTTERLLQ